MADLTPKTPSEQKAYEAAYADTMFHNEGNGLLWGRVSERCKAIYIARQRELMDALAAADQIAYEQGI